MSMTIEECKYDMMDSDYNGGYEEGYDDGYREGLDSGFYEGCSKVMMYLMHILLENEELQDEVNETEKISHAELKTILEKLEKHSPIF